MAIDKYIYLSTNRKFDGRTRLSYAITESVDGPEKLKHDRARACLLLFNESGLEITSVSDAPGKGCGLGTSSSFTVGLLQNLSARWGAWSPSTLAEMAYSIEAKMCGHPLGKQDQYAAAYGGFHFYEFKKDGSVRVEPLCLSDEQKEYLNRRLMLLWIGRARKADTVLASQSTNLSSHSLYYDRAIQMRDLAIGLMGNIKRGDLACLGEYLHLNWLLKKKLAVGISSEKIDGFYDSARKAGAMGGKICGAGGGGFLLFFSEPDRQKAIEEAVGLRRVDFKMEESGSKVVYNNEPVLES
jgi:D-glycero-alpha-D-manno-heptose-7-phosphate kinase